MLTITIGFIGMALILLAFFMSEIRRWNVDIIVYQLLNFAGALLLMSYAILIKSWPFLILNAVWALVSLKDMIEDFRKKKPPKKTKKRRKKK